MRVLSRFITFILLNGFMIAFLALLHGEYAIAGYVAGSVSLLSGLLIFLVKAIQSKRKLSKKTAIINLDIPPQEDFPRLLQTSDGRKKIFNVISRVHDFINHGGDLSTIDLPAWAMNQELLWIYSYIQHVGIAAQIVGLLIDEDGTIPQWYMWLNLLKYETGLPEGFVSGENLAAMGLSRGRLFFLSFRGVEYIVPIESIVRTKPLPTREKVRFQITWRRKTGQLHDTVVYLDAQKQTRHLDDGKSREIWNNEEAIKEIDGVQQQIIRWQEQKMENSCSTKINANIDTKRYRGHLDKMLKTSASPKDLLSDIHGLFESLMKDLLGLKHSQISFADLIDQAHLRGLIEYPDKLHAARKVRNKRSHQPHMVNDKECLDAARIYIEEFRKILGKISTSETTEGEDWRASLMEG